MEICFDLTYIQCRQLAVYFYFQCQPISNSGYLIVIQDTLVIIWFVCSCLIFHIVINSGLRVSIIKFPKFICKIIGASKQTNFDKSLKIPMVLQVYFRMVVTNEKQIFTGIERIINHEKYRSQTIIQIIWSTTNISVLNEFQHSSYPFKGSDSTDQTKQKQQ